MSKIRNRGHICGSTKNLVSTYCPSAAKVQFTGVLQHFHRTIKVHLFPALCTFWFLKKNGVSVTVLMIQLTRNSPTCIYIGQNPRKWKPR